MAENINKITMLRIGTVLHDTYRIDGYLSSGGFGNTYVATNIAFEERVAIKEFFMKGVSQRDGNQTTVSISNSDNAQQFEEQLEKFKKEARRLRRLNNEHIVSVHDLFEENGTAYYVMDYVDGESLSALLKRTGKPLPEQEVWNILQQVLDALKIVHKNGIWHLDLKPANIMLDKEGVVKLIDFGASKQLNAQKGGATTSTAVSYTAGYAPKEQVAQFFDMFGPWTDLYSLGATLYKLLTNNNPPQYIEIEENGQNSFVFPNSISRRMRDLVRWMMQPNRKDRPQNTEDIDRWLKGADEEGESQETYVPPVKKQVRNDEETIYSVRKQAKHEEQVKEKSVVAATAEPVKPIKTTTKQKNLNRWWLIGALSVIILGIVVLMIINRGGGTESDNFGEPARSASWDSSTSTLTVNDVSYRMVSVQGGTFQMGSEDGFGDEKPVHSVTLSSYYIGQTEVTQALWKAVMGGNPSNWKGDNLPVECVSWNDCQTFITKLNQLTGKTFRLPTEAEWEFAAKGGTKSQDYIYSGSNNIYDVAWHDINSCDETHEVATKFPNELDLYDMSGNVWEWCQDWYGDYSSSSQTNPTGPSSGSNRVDRGGSWTYDATNCRTACRNYSSPTLTFSDLGFRLAL